MNRRNLRPKWCHNWMSIRTFVIGWCFNIIAYIICCLNSVSYVTWNVVERKGLSLSLSLILLPLFGQNMSTFIIGNAQSILTISIYFIISHLYLEDRKWCSSAHCSLISSLNTGFFSLLYSNVIRSICLMFTISQ